MDTVMSILDEAIVIHGADGELVFANPAAARMLGYETSEDAVAAPTASIRDRYVIRDEHGQRGRRRGARRPPGPARRAGGAADAARDRPQDRRGALDADEGARRSRGRPGEILYSVTAIEDVTDVKRAEFANRLLARTGELLSHSTDYRGTLERVPQLHGARVRRLVLDRGAPRRRLPATGRDGASRCVPASAAAHAARSLPAARRRALADRRRDAHRRASARSSRARSGCGRSPPTREHLELLRELEMGSVISVPMTAAAKVVGVLVFVNEVGSRVFDDNDLEIASEVGRRAALAIENARIADERARVADALQRELLPPSLPRMPGWEVATMYEPAGEINEVGGDFYEVFPVDERLGGRPRRRLRQGSRRRRGDRGGAAHDPRPPGRWSADPVAGLAPARSASSAAATTSRSARSRWSCFPTPRPRRPRCSCTSPAIRIRCCSGAAAPSRSASPGPLLGVVDEPTWDPVRGDDRARRSAGALHRRGDRGARRRRGALRQRAAARRPRRLRGPRARRSSGCAVRSRRSAPTLATTMPPWSRSGASRPSRRSRPASRPAPCRRPRRAPDGPGAGRRRPPPVPLPARGGRRPRSSRSRSRRSPARPTWRSSRSARGSSPSRSGSSRRCSRPRS